jgi:hypothetical protein
MKTPLSYAASDPSIDYRSGNAEMGDATSIDGAILRTYQR